MNRESGSEGSDPIYCKIDDLVWCRREPDGTVTVGFIMPPGAGHGPIRSYSPRRVGKHIRKGLSCATLEWLDWVEPTRSPVGGTVVEVNCPAQEDPSLISRDPFGAGWVARLDPDDWESDSADLTPGRPDDLLGAINPGDTAAAPGP